jgi:hypothetical protein
LGRGTYIVVCVDLGIKLAVSNCVADVDILLPPLLDEVCVVAEVAVFTRDATIDFEDTMFAQTQSGTESVWHAIVRASD